MSLTTTLLRASALGIACLAGLGACSNSPDRQITALSVGKSVLKGRSKPQMPSAAQISADVAKALAATDASLILLSVPNRKAVTVMQQLEQNQGYTTYGTADRRSVTLRGGMMTATRGLGNDLMSSNVGAVQSLIAGRQNGTAQREMRHLDGEDLTHVQISTCTVRAGSSESLRVAEINAVVTDVSEHCSDGNAEFTNTYRVASDGKIIQSRQWHSPLNQYIVIQSLR